jgi:two-component system, cell cycle sensor histidine kinase and response regulator CckA
MLEQTHEPETAKNKKKYVLLIDDEAVIREIGSEMLEALHLPFIIARDGEEGIRVYKKNHPDVQLVILDIEMPGMSGDQVYDQLKTISPDLKILLTSGYAKSYLEAKYFKRKLDPAMFMSKPFQFKQLSEKLKSIMGI